MSDPAEAGAERVGHRSRHKLRLGPRVEVLRLAGRGQGHPQPEVSMKAFGWASDRLRSPLWHDLLWLAIGGLVGPAVVLLLLAMDHQRVGPVLGVFVTIAVVGTVGCGGWTVYVRRRVAEVARLNRPS